MEDVTVHRGRPGGAEAMSSWLRYDLDMGTKTKTAKATHALPGRADPTAGIDYGLSGLGELLRGYRLRVPKYQRNYAWDDEHVTDLLDDLAGAIEKNEPRHFVGSIVLTRLSKEDLEIVDGQQRLATAFMVLCAIRDYFKTQNDTTRADAVTSKYICTSDLKSKAMLARLALNGNDNAFFQYHVVDRPQTQAAKIKASTASHDRIKGAFERVERVPSAV